jgi:molecular chaperone GrpE (heat shock protein)
LGGLPPPVPQAGLGINGETIPENAPFQKSFQSNTIVPNKSTLVEDDDDASGFDDNDDRRSDAFALDKVLQSRRETTATLASTEKDKKLADAEAQISSLESKIEDLESRLRRKDEEIESVRGNEETKVHVSFSTALYTVSTAVIWRDGR